jgi:hypothetical protein
MVTPFAVDRNLYLGKVDTTRRTMHRARAARSEEDKPWSLAVSSELTDSLVTHEALPDVLSVWRWHQIGQTPFTIRQAKWAARLRAIVHTVQPHRRALVLARMALAYSSEELASLSLRQSFDTRHLDTLLAYPRNHDDHNDLATLSAEQAAEFVAREAGYVASAAMAAQALELIARWKRLVLETGHESPYPFEMDRVTLEERPMVLDHVAQEILSIIEGSLLQGKSFNRDAVDLVILAERREDRSGELWGRLSPQLRQKTTMDRYQKALKGDRTSWPATWTLTP